MKLRELKLFCIETIQLKGPENVPLAGRILAEISFYEIYKGMKLSPANNRELKHRLKVVLAKYGSSPNRKLPIDEKKSETNVQAFIRSDNTPDNKPETFTFLKEPTGWYIDLPEYLASGGRKSDLAMIAGADTMLDMMAANNRVLLKMGIKPFSGADLIEMIRYSDPDKGGGDYVLRTFEGREINHEMWLCEVTEFVFGYLPENIYVRRMEEGNK